MDWLFGCFGGLGRRARKRAVSQKISQQSGPPLPIKVPSPSLTASTGFAYREGANNDGILHGSQDTNCQPSRDAGGAICQKSSERTPEKSKKGDHQGRLYDLEEELEDLTKQIEKETFDARKIKEEVTFLKSCGTLLQTPAELRKKERTLELQQEESPTKGWHSWLIPVSSPHLKLMSTDEGFEFLATTGEVKDMTRQGLQSPISDIEIMNREKLNIISSPTTMCDANFQTSEAAHKPSCKADISFSSVTDTREREGLSTFVGSEFAETKGMIDAVGDNFSESQGNSIMALEKETESLAGTDKITAVSNNKEHIFPTVVISPLSTRKLPELRSTVHADAELTAAHRSFNDRYQMYETSEYTSHTVPQSASGTLDWAESDECRSSTCYDYLLVDNGIRWVEEGQSARESCSSMDTESHFNDSIFPSASSIDSEETVTDLSSTVESSMLSINPDSHLESVTSCKIEEIHSSFCTDEVISTPHCSHGSTQNSVAQAYGRRPQSMRYNNECCETEDELSSADSTNSRVSLECGHSNMKNQFSGVKIDQNIIKTPNNILQWADTPELARPRGVRSRPSSPVLAPVENAVQWRQLKRRQTNGENVQSFNYIMGEKHQQVNRVKVYMSVSAKDDTESAEQRNENGIYEVRTNQGHVHAFKVTAESLKICPESDCTPINFVSDWMTPLPRQQGGGDLKKSSNGTPEVSTNMSFSSWLHTSSRKEEAKGSSTTPTVMQQRNPTQCIDDRPILTMMIPEDKSSNSVARRVHWDGQGIPNTTTKYKEDQRVSWHSSPFEERLERALKKEPCQVPQATPVSNRLRSLQ
ncbi:hypothetical protein KP509_19G012700 [Ceratopteris richardii]|uniref:Uncharacterized protein n=2 Tax=Ceratopteris richardii TaxID=49495 RepID=A0A8T2SK32_CERRI|nr:hypothetical protein KP509_19G012700 [Ceratopteris richardii]